MTCTPACAAVVAVPLPAPPPPYDAGTPPAATLPPAPTISEMSPPWQPVELGSVTVNLRGTGFTSNSVIEFNGNALPTIFLDATRVQAVLPASAAGLYPVTVTDAGGTSTAKQFEFFTIAVPTITGVAPRSAPLPKATFSVNGTNFTANTVVIFDGNPVQTNYVSSTQVRGTVTVQRAGSYSVAVLDRSGRSNVDTFAFT